MLYFILIFIFIEVILVSIIISNLWMMRKPIMRLDDYLRWEQQKREDKRIKTNFKGAFRVLGKQIVKIFALNRYKERLDKRLIRADIPLRAEEMMFIIIMSVLLIFPLTVFFTNRISVGILFSILTVLIVNIIIRSKEQKRLKVINEQLGSAIDMMTGSLRAGYSLAQSIETVAREMPEPISKEFKQMVKEMAIGLDIEKALENLLDRVPSDDLELLITAVVIQRQVGGNLAEILDNISKTIVERIKLKREVRTLTAQGRISGLIIGLLPLVIMMLVFVLNPEYMKTLFTHSIGITMLIIGLIGQIVGFLLIKKIVNIQY